MEKEELMNFLKYFQKNVTLKKVCEKIEIDPSNVSAGRSSVEKLQLVKAELIKEIGKLLTL